MSKIQRFEEMEVWQSARILAGQVYSLTGKYPFSGDYALRDQIHRASISIVSNIAEGFESQTNPSFCRFLASARGSAAEVRAQLQLALDFGYITQSDLEKVIPRCESISRQLTGLINYLKSTEYPK